MNKRLQAQSKYDWDYATDAYVHTSLKILNKYFSDISVISMHKE